MLTLSVVERTKSHAPARLMLRTGKVPGVVYGRHQKAVALAIDAMQFSKVLHEAGEATIVSLTGLGTDLPTLIHAVDFDPLSNQPRHVDFYAVTKGESVQVAIPLSYAGESPAVKAGANLVKVLYEIEVEADPMNLPHEIEVDISQLVNVDDQIHAGQLPLPPGVTLAIDSEEVVALAQAVVEETEEVAAASIDSIEVEKKGKEEAESAEEGA